MPKTPTYEETTMRLIKWKEQSVKECVTWAGLTTSDPKQLEAFKGGVSVSWDQCLNVLKFQGLLKIN